MRYRFLSLLLAGCLAGAAAAQSVSRSDGDGRPFLPPLMGWSSWNTYHVDINEQLIERQADALFDTGLAGAGYRYVNIDDGFFGWRDSTGRMHAHPERFPRGMKPVSDYIHSLGLRAGIYSDAGDNTCGSIYDDDANGVGAGLYGHEVQDMELYLKEWNFDFIKIDYCGARNLGLEEQKRYRTICDAIAATGRTDVSINICRWAFPGTWAAGMARSWRISPDIRPRWSSVKSIVEKNLYLSAYAGNGHYNDMDMLEIGRGLTPEEEEVHFGLWCLLSSPLLIGCDLTAIPPASLQLLKNKELIALNQDPLGLQAYVAQREGDCYVLVKDIERRRGTVRAVALFNASDSLRRIAVALEELELAGRVRVRDLVKGADLPSAEDSLSCELAPHSVLICRLEAERRLDPVRFEAEWAYLPCYDDLGKNPLQVAYAPSPRCSGGMKVLRLGGREENYAEWSGVYSSRGGDYEMKIDYCSPGKRKLEVWINGERFDLPGLDSGGEDIPASAVLQVRLQPGYNTVRMGNRFGWAPDIDCFTLSAR